MTKVVTSRTLSILVQHRVMQVATKRTLNMLRMMPAMLRTVKIPMRITLSMYWTLSLPQGGLNAGLMDVLKNGLVLQSELHVELEVVLTMARSMSTKLAHRGRSRSKRTPSPQMPRIRIFGDVLNCIQFECNRRYFLGCRSDLCRRATKTSSNNSTSMNASATYCRRRTAVASGPIL